MIDTLIPKVDQSSDLVLLGSVALGADEDADDAGVAVPGRRVQRRVTVVVLDVRPAAAEQEDLRIWIMV